MMRRSLRKRATARASLGEIHKAHTISYKQPRSQQMKRRVHTFTLVLMSIVMLYTSSFIRRDSNVVAPTSGYQPLRTAERRKHLWSSPRMVKLEWNDGLGLTSLWNVSRTQPPSRCIPRHKWQLPQFGPSSCNLMHEIGPEMEIINCGSSRCAFQINGGEKGRSVVLKIPMLESQYFTPEFVEVGWTDTIAMERLSPSPFVLDIFGNCGVSQIIEIGQSSLFDLINIARIHGEDNMSAEDKLRVGFHLASGIADVHSIDGDSPSLVHNDVDPSQVVLVDGVYKINDFHMGSMIKYTPEPNGKACPERPHRVASWMDKGRAPEELKFKSEDYPDTLVRRDKADVWCLGNMLYNVLTMRWVFEGISLEDSIAKIIDGTQDGNPFTSVNTTDHANRAMVEAIQMAWTYSPDKRPTAREIADFLKEYISEEEGTFPWPVSIPALPKNYKYPDFDDFAETY